MTNYNCKYCQYATDKKTDYTRHLGTKKHNAMKKKFMNAGDFQANSNTPSGLADIYSNLTNEFKPRDARIQQLEKILVSQNIKMTDIAKHLANKINDLSSKVEQLENKLNSL